jgi:hypothetical protein
MTSEEVNGQTKTTESTVFNFVNLLIMLVTVPISCDERFYKC